MRTLAILPVKSFSHAKQRLSSGIEPQLRSRLAEAMLRDVLSALAVTSVDDVVVVTAGEAPAALARDQGARVIADREQGHNAAALLGMQEAVRIGAERVLLVPADCPAMDPSELDQLLRQPRDERSVVIVPDRHRTGTNALLISPPDALQPAFGPGSCERHAELARTRGIAHEIVAVPSLALDIDTPADLVALSELRDGGLRTTELLARC